MMRLRLLGVFCACVLPLVYSPVSHAATVQYDYTGNDFNMNDGSMPLCTPGDPGCFSHITASIELSAELGGDFAFQTVVPLAWSISDGLKTIDDQTTGFYLFNLKVGTDAGGDISRWVFEIARNTSPPLGELSGMRTMSDAGFSTADETNYCTRLSSGGTCNYVARAWRDDTPGTWNLAPVPLPASVWLLGSGLMGLLGVARRRKAA